MSTRRSAAQRVQAEAIIIARGVPHDRGAPGRLITMISQRAKERAKEEASRKARRASRCTTARQMAVRFAGSGTTHESAADSNAVDFTFASYALAAIQLMHVTVQARARTRPVRGPRAPRALESMSPGERPQLLRARFAQRGAHGYAGCSICLAGPSEKLQWLPSCKIEQSRQRHNSSCTRLTSRIHRSGT